MRSVQLESPLSASPEAVWERVSTFEGVNDELRPVLRMTAPASVRRLDPSEVVLGERIIGATFRHRHRRLRRRFG